ncbi:MAG: hypothetical protein HPY83_00350 [Anaerolineae bacterium]|nr:hypothetical protein [Anaerolineae bacterium]
MKSISVSWSSEVQDDEAVQSLAAIVGVITSLYYTRWPWGLISPIVGLRPFGNWVIPALQEGSDYSSFDWYVESSLDPSSDAVDADRFLELVEHEPWQRESSHYDFSVVRRPLRRAECSEPVPLACRPGVAAVVSTDWVRGFGSLEGQRLALRRLSMYGIGRAMGLQPHDDDATLCAMRSFHGRADLLSKAMDEHAQSVIYCEDHLSDLLSTLLSGRSPLN